MVVGLNVLSEPTGGLRGLPWLASCADVTESVPIRNAMPKSMQWPRGAMLAKFSLGHLVTGDTSDTGISNSKNQESRM